MSTIEEELRTQLLADATVASLVTDRILPDVAPGQITLPCVVYTHVNSVETYDLTPNPYIEQARIEYSCLATTWKGARALLEALRTKALTVKGLFNGITIDSIFVADVRDQGFNKITNSYQIDLDLEIFRQL